MSEHMTEMAQPAGWAAKHYTKPCDSCCARVGQPCRTASGYVTMRHASRRRADASRSPVSGCAWCGETATGTALDRTDAGGLGGRLPSCGSPHHGLGYVVTPPGETGQR